jgi:hypothetical protein
MCEAGLVEVSVRVRAWGLLPSLREFNVLEESLVF